MVDRTFDLLRTVGKEVMLGPLLFYLYKIFVYYDGYNAESFLKVKSASYTLV